MVKEHKKKDFLQAEEWRQFQAAVGRRTFAIANNSFEMSIIEHRLPVVGVYFYAPRWSAMEIPISKSQSRVLGTNLEFQNFLSELLALAKKEKAGWIRFDTNNEEELNIFRHQMSQMGYQIKKAPHDMQPREVFIIDITKSEEELLKEMSSKTRYNVRLAEKKGVSLRITNLYESTNKNDIDEFLRLVRITSERNKITSHPEEYYRKMLEMIPAEMLKLYVAEYEGKVIAANSVIFYGDTATYLHGASDNQYRNVMAPYLLQWKQICEAKKVGCVKYDMGGINTKISNSSSSWSGITKFKTGFSSRQGGIEFSGSYDIVINPAKYYLYRVIQKVKSWL